MTNVSTGDKYYNYEMHTLTAFYVRATNDTCTCIYVTSVSPFSGAADVS